MNRLMVCKIVIAIAFASIGCSTITSAQERVVPASALGVKDIPHIVAAGQAEFEKTYKGKLYTARMTVNDVTARSTAVAVGFNSSGTHVTFPPINCNVSDLRDVGSAREGEIMWVSGILQSLLGSTIFLEPCEISLTQEPSVVPQPWKAHPPRQ
jgi:hypothetical protein